MSNNDEALNNKIVSLDNELEKLQSQIDSIKKEKADVTSQLSVNVKKLADYEMKQQKKKQLANLLAAAYDEIAEKNKQIKVWLKEMRKLHDCEFDGHNFEYDDDGGPMERYCQFCRRSEEEFPLF